MQPIKERTSPPASQAGSNVPAMLDDQQFTPKATTLISPRTSEAAEALAMLRQSGGSIPSSHRQQSTAHGSSETLKAYILRPEAQNVGNCIQWSYALDRLAISTEELRIHLDKLGPDYSVVDSILALDPKTYQLIDMHVKSVLGHLLAVQRTSGFDLFTQMGTFKAHSYVFILQTTPGNNLNYANANFSKVSPDYPHALKPEAHVDEAGVPGSAGKTNHIPNKANSIFAPSAPTAHNPDSQKVGMSAVGSAPAPVGSLFSTYSNPQATASLFGGQSLRLAPPLFGNVGAAFRPSPGGGGLFGNATLVAPSSGYPFTCANPVQYTQGGSLFGNAYPAAPNAGGLFNAFGSALQHPAGGMFCGSLFGNAPTSGSLFPNTQPSIFGAPQNSRIGLFGNQASPALFAAPTNTGSSAIDGGIFASSGGMNVEGGLPDSQQSALLPETAANSKHSIFGVKPQTAAVDNEGQEKSNDG